MPNDNSPVFDQGIYEVELSENMPINYPVMQITAHDADLGEIPPSFPTV